jgi:hypothetical protein
MKQAFHFITDTIHIPILTTFFEVFAEQDFSVVNCMTFLSAGLMNVLFAIKDRKLPFEVMEDPSTLIANIPDSALDLGPIFGMINGKRTATNLDPGTEATNPIATADNHPLRKKPMAAMINGNEEAEKACSSPDTGPNGIEHSTHAASPAPQTTDSEEDKAKVSLTDMVSFEHCLRLDDLRTY